jgi:PPK2 family polyphosphate:nucleotide phosphotransferase
MANIDNNSVKDAEKDSMISEIDEMKTSELISMASKLAKKYRVTGKHKFRLDKYSTKARSDLAKAEKPVAQKLLDHGIETLAAMQDKLYAQDKWALLVIFQAMDAAGKDGAIKHVMSGINPQGCQVTSFKSPSAEELDHDYLWRCMKNLPERGRIGIFNRSYYEEVLVVRVHEDFLKAQKIPPKLVTDNIWKERMADIRNFEKYLNNNGILIVKIFLNVSKKEQKKRFLERIDTPEKNWKFSKSDLAERQYWDQYIACYDELIRETSAPKSPWYVVPADNKPFARIVVAAAIIHAMDSMKLAYPKVAETQVAELQRLKSILLEEKR